MNRGEVWWTEAAGARRPYLILTRQAAIPILHSLLAVPATRTIRDIPTQIELDESDGMPEACALSLDNLTLVPKPRFASRICTLGPDKLSATCAALGEAVDCLFPPSRAGGAVAAWR